MNTHADRDGSEVPAGPPLHEPTDRDADNVPSDRVERYVLAIIEAADAHRDSDLPEYDEAVARAVMAVADREREQDHDTIRALGAVIDQHEAENERLRASLRWLHQRSIDLRDNSTIPVGTALRRLHAAIAAQTLEARVNEPTEETS